MKKKLIVIAGPTASGKTSLAVELAKQFKCPIISADSRQFYKEMSIGTAKPTETEMDGIKHYFINSHSINSPLSAGKYEQESLEIIQKEFLTHDQLILVGGSGMYIDAVVFGTDKIPHSKSLREKWNALYKNNGIRYLQKELKLKDPSYFKTVDKNNHVRLIRALEVIELTGETYSSLRKNTRSKRTFNTYYFVINHSREVLYERINSRVDTMISMGLINEVKDLIQFRELQPLNTVGYKEIFDYLDGKSTKQEAIELIKQNTRRYAKRQITWFKRHDEVKWIDFNNINSLIDTVNTQINTNQ